jgi:hypothetical protein
MVEANDLVQGQRQNDYGHPKANFGRISGLWSIYLGMEISDHDVANLMILLKIARGRHTSCADNNIDIIGYAAIAEDLL